MILFGHVANQKSVNISVHSGILEHTLEHKCTSRKSATSISTGTFSIYLKIKITTISISIYQSIKQETRTQAKCLYVRPVYYVIQNSDFRFHISQRSSHTKTSRLDRNLSNLFLKLFREGADQK